MTWRCLLFCGIMLLAGCAEGSGPAQGKPRGYVFHDANHQGGMAPSSPQAERNAAEGTWLWPPAENDFP